MSSQRISYLRPSSAFMTNLIANPARFYFEKERPKMKFGKAQLDQNGKEKKRITFAPIAFLKFIQKEINNLLQEVILPKCMFGAIRGKNNIQNASEHRYGNYFFTVDLKDFFSNISNKQVNSALRGYGFSCEDARIITKLCTSNRCLPQGAPTSSTLANMVFASTAAYLEAFSIERGITFTVFVDDLTFSAKHDFSSCRNQILQIIRQSGFFPHNKKIRYRHKSCEITGLIVRNHRLWLEKGMLDHLDNPGIKAYADNVDRHFKM